MSEGGILLIEDNPHILRMMQIALRRLEMRLITAASVREAVAHLRSAAADIKLIITDYVLPDANGGDVAEFARRQPLTSGIPILLVSAEVADPKFTKMVSNGDIDAYIPKPFSIADFLNKVQELLGKRTLQTAE